MTVKFHTATSMVRLSRPAPLLVVYSSCHLSCAAAALVELVEEREDKERPLSSDLRCQLLYLELGASAERVQVQRRAAIRSHRPSRRSGGRPDARREALPGTVLENLVICRKASGSVWLCVGLKVRSHRRCRRLCRIRLSRRPRSPPRRRRPTSPPRTTTSPFQSCHRGRGACG
jgi:hypothetical protein